MSFPFGSLLTAAKMTQVASNFAALAYQESGAPVINSLHAAPLFVGSGIVAPDQNSFGSINVASSINLGAGMSAPGVGSFGTVQVGSGLVAPQVSSLGSLQVGSGIVAPQVSSFGLINVGVGRTTDQYSGSGKFFLNVETIISSMGLAVKGNEVDLDAVLAAGSNLSVLKTVLATIRVGSLGGAVVAQMAADTSSGPGTSRNCMHLFGNHTPASGTVVYNLTAQNQSDSSSMAVFLYIFRARETDRR